KTRSELAAMKVAMDYERAGGREPIDVSKTGGGYDIRSEGAHGEVRYIEAKGRAAEANVTLYYTEWQTANRMRDEFFIYYVTDPLKSPKLWIIQDPVGRGLEPEERIVEYRFEADQLLAVAVEA
ncbi:MAG: DUF3883 domain-containing protein, partial [Chloroflexi bacterium]